MCRLCIATGLFVVVLAPSFLGVTEPACTRIIVVLLRVTGLEDIHPIRDVWFAVGKDIYEVDFWCTPSVLASCGIGLLWFARQDGSAYFWTCLAFVGLSVFLTLGSTVVSIHLDQAGVDWVWAHYPAAILAYSGSLIGCLIFAEIRQRRIVGSHSPL